METNKTYQVGEYYLTQNRSGAWCRTWYDSTSKQRKSVSLRTKDFSVAKAALDDWFILNSRPVLQDDMELAQCLVRYYEDHAKHLTRHDSEKRNLRYWLDFFGDTKVSEIDANRQRAFLRDLHARGMAKTTIQGIFKTGVSAVHFCRKEGMLLNDKLFIDVAKDLKKFQFKKSVRWTAIEPEEMVKMFEHAKTEKITRYLMLLIAGTSRSTAGIEISGSSIDLDAGTIDLLLDDSEQTNKYRATVKLPTFIRAIYCEGNLCSQTDKVPNLNNLRNREWIPTREAAGVKSTVTPYSVRHGMAKWLRACSVDPWHVSAQLGHKRKGSEITEVYAEFDPTYLSDVLEAIEGYFAVIHSKSPALRRFMEGTSYEARCDLVAKYRGILQKSDVSL